MRNFHQRCGPNTHDSTILRNSAGIIAARTFHEQGFDNFLIVEARDELGGRMKSTTFGSKGNEHTVELGANWVQGMNTLKSTGLL